MTKERGEEGGVENPKTGKTKQTDVSRKQNRERKLGRKKIIVVLKESVKEVKKISTDTLRELPSGYVIAVASVLSTCISSPSGNSSCHWPFPIGSVVLD
ncbi:hypothetical protein NPIL_457431 [Nephila pilipes]|uniref:Uncharacterized protein n=1 Tax=Nephila pilipes TaxID=299642 RepID=A0A8X6QSX2_NEPPI|nr:hypothetical protein NPIL_457431 [Nephila pilipes]